MTLPDDIAAYHDAQSGPDREICDVLGAEIAQTLADAEGKVWHGHPVWFFDGNPVVGYAVRKKRVQLLFWSGQSFDEPGLASGWLGKARDIQWDYKNIRARRGVLEPLPPFTGDIA